MSLFNVSLLQYYFEKRQQDQYNQFNSVQPKLNQIIIQFIFD